MANEVGETFGKYIANIFRLEKKPLFVALLSSLAMALTLQGMPGGVILSSDSAIYSYVGWIVSQGGMPYTDAWDNKGPVTYLVYALAYLISHDHGAWLLSTVLFAFSTFLLYCIARKIASAWVASLATVLVVVCAVAEPLPLLTEYISLPASCWVAFLAIQLVYRREIPSAAGSVSLGVSLAAIFLVRPNNVFPLIPLGVIAVIVFIQIRGVWRFGAFFLQVASGALLLAAPIAIWLWRGNSLRACLHSAYLGALQWNQTLSQSLANVIRLTVGNGPLPVAMGFVYMIFAYHEIRNRGNRAALLLISSIIVGMIVFFIGNIPLGNNYPHYLVVCFPLWVAAYSQALNFCQQTVSKYLSTTAKQSLVVVSVVAGVILSSYTRGYVNSVGTNLDLGSPQNPPVDTRIRDFVDGSTLPSDLVLTDSWNINYNAQRKSPSRYFYRAMTTWLPETISAIDTVVADEVQENKPALIIFTSQDAFNAIAQVIDPNQSLRWQNFISTHYHIEQRPELGNYMVLRINDPN